MKKNIFYRTRVIECGGKKKGQIYFIYVKKNELVFGCFRIEEIREKDNKQVYSAFHIRDASLSLSLLYLPIRFPHFCKIARWFGCF